MGQELASFGVLESNASSVFVIVGECIAVQGSVVVDSPLRTSRDSKALSGGGRP